MAGMFGTEGGVQMVDTLTKPVRLADLRAALA
jgi:hypothetical protein